jgi:thioester reductase-like protein
MRQIGEKPYDGFHSYNFINVHRNDGISLDTMVDWVQSAGYAVQRIDNHAEWVRRFEEKLRNLTEQDRQ